MRRALYNPLLPRSDQPVSTQATREGTSKKRSQNRKRLDELADHRKKSRVSHTSAEHPSQGGIQPEDLERFNQSDESDHQSKGDRDRPHNVVGNSNRRGVNGNSNEQGNLNGLQEKEIKGISQGDDDEDNENDEDYEYGKDDEENENDEDSEHDDDDDNDEDEENKLTKNNKRNHQLARSQRPAHRPISHNQNLPSGSSSNFSHLTGPALQVFNQISTRAELDEDHQVMGRKLCNEETPQNQFMAVMVSNIATHQEATNLRKELAEHAINSNAIKNIMQGDIQAYTSLEDKEGDQDQLPHSLYARTLNAMLAYPRAWKKKHLPAGYGKDADSGDATLFNQLIRTVLKEARKEFKDILLTNIRISKQGVLPCKANVPVIDSIWVRLYKKEHGKVGGEIKPRDDIVKELTHLQSTRYAFLRMQACHAALNPLEYNSKTVWAIVDEKLEFLYFFLCLQLDHERFDGKKTFEELGNTTDFSLPNETCVHDLMKELDETFGNGLSSYEDLYENAKD
ncbi:hypothetical protein DFH28DRAFT_1134372 [Melampsora americana]|nr:hypothetical protein DFH28DRAFT_1134372 [Melampsora americana]